MLTKLRAPDARAQLGIDSVERDQRLARLLLIRVGPAWSALPERRRIAAAEEWQSLWDHAVPGGIVAILDAVTDQALVNFDANGRAVLKQPAATPRPPQHGS